MAIRVLVNGFSGKMGSIAIKAIQEEDELLLAAKTRRGDDLIAAINDSKSDVVLDFTGASVVFDNTQKIIESGASPVIGTSGLVEDQVDQLGRLCAQKQLGGIVVPNFSISAVLMMKYAQDAIRYLRQAEIIELHHNQKEDSPSGTAIRTAEMISEGWRDNSAAQKEKATIPGARSARYKHIPIHSVRLPGLVAHQEVLLGGIGKTLSIKSNTISREAFIPGIRLACKQVVKLTELHYGLEHLL
jgi:4-hydroxy-tetrahydrodipicolinate reductase